MPKKTAPEPVSADALIERQEPQVQALMRAALVLLRAAIPEPSEKVYLGWSAIWFYTGVYTRMNELLLAIGPQKSYINLEFGDGAALPDPSGLLEGSGKRLRHVKVRAAADLERPALRALIDAAVALRRGEAAA